MDKNAKKQNVLGDEALDKVSGGFGSKNSSLKDLENMSSYQSSVIYAPCVEGPENPHWVEKMNGYPHSTINRSLL